MKRKTAMPEEPKVACPVCQALTKQTEFADKAYGLDMCFRCAKYLFPGNNGTDHGLFMVRVETGRDGLRRAYIRPRGFWSDTIEVVEDEDRFASYEARTSILKQTVRWSTGGTDGTVDDIREAENFTRAMDHAVMLAKIWRMERQE